MKENIFGGRNNTTMEDLLKASEQQYRALKHGDVITKVNNRPVDSPASFYLEVAGAQGPVELTVMPLGQPEQLVKLQ